MSDQIGLVLKMLLPSVAISIAIHYLGNIVTLRPDNPIAAIVVFLPATVMGVVLWQRLGDRE